MRRSQEMGPGLDGSGSQPRLTAAQYLVKRAAHTSSTCPNPLPSGRMSYSKVLKIERFSTHDYLTNT